MTIDTTLPDYLYKPVYLWPPDKQIEMFGKVFSPPIPEKPDELTALRIAMYKEQPTLRDQFAMSVEIPLEFLLQHPSIPVGMRMEDVLVVRAKLRYTEADAMLEARKEKDNDK